MSCVEFGTLFKRSLFNLVWFTFTSLKIDQYEGVNSLGVKYLSKIKSTIKEKVSTDRASMILRKHDHSVLQSLCSIFQHLFDFFYFIICHLYALKMR